MTKRDEDTTVQELKDLIAKFSKDRNWGRHHTPKNLAVSIAIEAAELLEHFQWDEYQRDDKEAIASELADILAYTLNFATVMDIDVATAYRKKMKKIEKKYPVEIFNMEKVSKEDFFRIKKVLPPERQAMTPDEFTNQEFFLDVGDGHQLYVHDWGKADARLPILFLHGGPGSSFTDKYKQRFVPAKQRVVFFDQRGAGKSLPKGSLKHNTTDHLIEDIKKIVKHLEFEKFILIGGSWGSCLALAYALKHPEGIHAMVLNGIYTASAAETKHLDEGGFRNFFPDVWSQYVARAPKKYADKPSAYHYSKAFGSDPEDAKRSIYAYSELEASLLSIDDRHTPQNFDEFEPEDMKIELHYLKNDCFLPERYILDNAHKLKMPVWLVQGRYDMVCPPITAYELSKRLPNCQLIWTVAGHSNDRPNYDMNRTILLQMTGD